MKEKGRAMKRIGALAKVSASVLVAAAFGCGSSSDDGLGLTGGSGGTGAAASGGGGGFGALGGGAGSGGGGSVDDRIDPIELGYAWTYDVEIYGTYPLCKAGSHTGQVLGQKEVGGKNAFQVQSLCPAAGVSSYHVDGDRVEVYLSGVWALALDAPVQEGHSWSNGVTTYTWEDAGSVTVPAGTFDNCWTAREDQAADSYTTFCRGVGPVIWHTLVAGNGFDARLTAKNF